MNAEQRIEVIDLAIRYDRLYNNTGDVCSVDSRYTNGKFVPSVHLSNLNALREFQPDESQWIDDGADKYFQHHYHVMVHGVYVHCPTEPITCE